MKRKFSFPRKEPRFAPWLFSLSWEQRKLGDFCKIDIGEFVIRTKQRDDAPYPVYNGGSSYTGFYDEFNQDGKKVIVSARGANAGFVNKCETPYWAGNSCYSIGVLDDTDWIFLYHAIKHVQLEFIKGQQSANIPSVSKEQVQKTEVACPSCQEQKKIAVFLEALDTLITLHQRKYDQLVNIKKSMLEKMFPKNGELVPEVRFAGFTDAWEQREFGEIVSEYVDPVSTPTKGYYRLGIKSHAKGTFHSYVRPGMELGTAQMHRVAANNFIVNITFGWEHAVAITTEDDAGKLVSHRFPQFSFSAGMVPAYFKYLILDEDFRHHLWLASPGGAGRNRVLKISEMLEYKFWVPSQEEQQKISILLTKLDALITLHQCKLERLQNIKKACLEKMFV